MTPQVSAPDFHPSEIGSVRLSMRPGCVCGPGNVPMGLWIAARYDVEHLPPGQHASIYLSAGVWNIKRVINGIEFRQYKPHPAPEDALRELQVQIDQEATNLCSLSAGELQRRMKRYRVAK